MAQDNMARARPSRLRRVLKKQKLGLLGLLMILLVVGFATLGPLLSQYDPNAQVLSARMIPPMSEHDGRLYVLGADSLGRDLFVRVMYGTRASLAVVGSSLLLGTTLGILLGLLAGFFGGWLDNVVMRLVDAQLSLPTTIFAMVIASVLGTGFGNTIIALGIISWPVYARLLRAEVLSVKERPFVEAATSLGASKARLMVQHVLPNVMNSVIVVSTLELGRIILVESSLSYIGLGMQPPDASLGSMIRDGQAHVFTDWRLATIPGVVIMMAVLGLNTVGDWLRDIFDPRMRRL